MVQEVTELVVRTFRACLCVLNTSTSYYFMRYPVIAGSFTRSLLERKREVDRSIDPVMAGLRIFNDVYILCEQG